MTAVVAGPANLGRGTKERAGRAYVAITLTKMNAISAHALGKRHAVVDNESDVEVSADPLERFRKSRDLILFNVFQTKLESSCKARFQGSLEPVGKRTSHIVWADEVKL